MTNFFKSASVKYPLLPESYLSKYAFSSPQMRLMKSHYSSGTYLGLYVSWAGLLSRISSNYFNPIPKYFLMNKIYSQNVIYPSLSVSRILNIYVRSPTSGFLLKKKQAYNTRSINYCKLIFLVFHWFGWRSA